jgi:hypothetical protein
MGAAVEIQQARLLMQISKRTLGAMVISLGAILATAALAGEPRFSWQKAPGPIAGRWSVSCREMSGMVVQFNVDGKKATGRISTLGGGSSRNYSNGEEIIKLETDDYGDWVGQLRWRGQGSSEHWDPIRFVATSQQLDATMTTDRCYNNMQRID